jgi:hypothetical protein
VFDDSISTIGSVTSVELFHDSIVIVLDNVENGGAVEEWVEK